MLSSTFLLLAATIFSANPLPGVSAATYNIRDTYVGESFYSGFSFEAIADPTAGRVNYVDQATAVADNLTYASGDTFIMRADSTTTLSASGPGRNSVRIKSYNTYTTHVAVFDMRHMPQGCGTWPAAWETQEDGWPAGGEVDIVEGVNDESPNQSTLHTTSGCTMPGGIQQTGNALLTDCDHDANGNAGCAVQNNKANNYGPAFNAAGGGWYAMERTNSFIRVFFWSRDDPSVPSGVSSGAETIDTDNWGEPYALFPNTQCDPASHFGPNNIIINLTFCGYWAGQDSIFNGAGCPGDCVDYVNNNPSAFVNAYFDFAGVRVYQ